MGRTAHTSKAAAAARAADRAAKENERVTLALKGVSDVGRSPTKPAPKARKASAREAMAPLDALVDALNDRGKEDLHCNGLLRIGCFTTKDRGHAWTLVSPRTGGNYLKNDKMRARLEAAGFEEDPDQAGRYVLYASDVRVPDGKSDQFKATVAALGLPPDPWAAPFDAATGDRRGWFMHPDDNMEKGWLPPLDWMEVPDTSSPLSHMTPLSPPTPINSQEAAEPPEMQTPLPPPAAGELCCPGAPKRQRSLAASMEMASSDEAGASA
jgi:hypothetical protein